MERQHRLIDLQTQTVDEGRGVRVISTYVVPYHRVLKTVHCPVPGCPEIAHITGRLQEHFIYQNYHSRVELVHEGRETLPC